MHMTPIRSYSVIWRQSMLTRQVNERRKHQNDLAVFDVLREMLQKSEYERMLARWHNGELEIYMERGLIITCYTPSERHGSLKG
jgi:hypothetical protein